MTAANPVTIRVGSRESQLALAQANQVMMSLSQSAEQQGLSVETVLHRYKTQGDLILDTALSQIGDKGLFVKELERALLQGEIDLAVHSAKDMPGELPAGLQLVSALTREDPRDVLLSLGRYTFETLPSGSVVGSSSLRRVAQLTALRPDLMYQTIRGNLQTRLRKLEEGTYQAIVLASAGVHRLGWQEQIDDVFPITQVLPAVGQGILAIEHRQGSQADKVLMSLLAALRHEETEIALQAERSFLQTLEGGCQIPVAAYLECCASGYQLSGKILSLDGQHQVSGVWQFTDPYEAAAVGQQAALELLERGGAQILADIRALGPATVNSPE